MLTAKTTMHPAEPHQRDRCLTLEVRLDNSIRLMSNEYRRIELLTGDVGHNDPIPLLSMRAVKLAALYDRLSDEPVRDALFKLALTLAGDADT
ncbi:hypothetical protein OCK02_24925 [Rhizobium sp. TRM96647]|uniref:hypothetical protein n=1 Tax=unclassified Rhizobium TaxID=2613769 RepID=UPI0021E833CE|nr:MULTISPECIES: hypothetical protein [unclassified Rhizobium]MCV3739403.1 hypothetical protein [Rhizobium sp. TRM96647]MCV3761069.1 hypothetical protein [Rhizobium sp. TRM96650]